MKRGTDLLFIHGPPAAGKLTVAKAILQIVPGELLDNHSFIDVAKPVFQFGTTEFWEMVKKTRLSAIDTAIKLDVPLLVSTSCYSHPEDYEAFEEVESIITRSNGRVFPVFLSCPPKALKDRVGNQDRVERQKLVTSSGLDEFLSHWSIAPVPRANCFKIDSEKNSEIENANTIIKHFSLKRN